jgi:hypothetical protein
VKIYKNKGLLKAYAVNINASIVKELGLGLLVSFLRFARKRSQFAVF